jgi:hypothetical protein
MVQLYLLLTKTEIPMTYYIISNNTDRDYLVAGAQETGQDDDTFSLSLLEISHKDGQFKTSGTILQEEHSLKSLKVKKVIDMNGKVTENPKEELDPSKIPQNLLHNILFNNN